MLGNNGFWKNNRIYLTANAVFILIFWAVSALYHIESEFIFYVISFMLIITVIAAFINNNSIHNRAQIPEYNNESEDGSDKVMWEKLREKEDFFALWAHQIKTPIAALKLLFEDADPNTYECKSELFKIETYVEMALNYLRFEEMSGDLLLEKCSLEPLVKLPLVLAGEDHRTMDDKVAPLVKELGIADLIHKYPYEVSGGQKQRTAVARALITKPQILLADEPTGALDSKAATNLMHQLRDIHKSGQTILMVTHSNVAASYADRVMFIRDGEVFHQIYRGNLKRSEMLDKICDAVTVLMRGGEDSE